jgi:hypothetical protein
MNDLAGEARSDAHADEEAEVKSELWFFIVLGTVALAEAVALAAWLAWRSD